MAVEIKYLGILISSSGVLDAHISAPILVLFQFDRPFILAMDASEQVMGYVLGQPEVCRGDPLVANGELAHAGHTDPTSSQLRDQINYCLKSNKTKAFY